MDLLESGDGNIPDASGGQASPRTHQDLLASGASELLKGFGDFTDSYLGGKSSAIEANYRAGELNRNADIESLRIRDLWNQESFESERASEKGAQLEGGEVAAQAGQGVNVHSAASESVTRDTSAMTARDMLTIKNNAFGKAFGMDMSILQDRSEAILQTMKAKQAQSAGFFGGITKFAGAGAKAVGFFDAASKMSSDDASGSNGGAQ